MKMQADTTSVIEVPNEGLISLLGKPILVFCMNYIYAGILEGVNDSCIKILNPHIVYETGEFKASEYKNKQSLATKSWFIQLNSIESFGLGK